jgi:HlyD family secretion protein
MKSMQTSGSSAASKRTGKLSKSILIVLAVLIVGGGAAWYFLVRPSQANNQAQAASTTRTTTVQRGNISLTASGQGTLIASESVNMSFSTNGKVTELNVKLGDNVKTGDVLARLEKAEDLEANLATAQTNLLAAQQTLAALQKKAGSTLAKAYQNLVNTQKTYNDALTESQRSKSVRCSPEVYASYKSTLEQVAETVDFLFKNDPESDAYIVARYDYDTALANYTYCASYTPREKTSAVSELEVAKPALEQAQDKYNSLKKASGVDPDELSMDETRVETAQTMVDNAQEKLDGITLKASIDGKITYLAASVGAIVDTSTFLTISDLSHPTVTFVMDATDMDKLVVGNAAVVTLTALPSKSFTGKVSVANPEMQSFGPFKVAFGQIEIDESFVKTLETVPINASATVKITGKEAKNVLVVPVAALKTLKNGDQVVTLVGNDGQVTQQVVSVGIEDSTNAEIISGLKEGDVVSVTTKNSTSSSSDQFQMGGDRMPGP